MGLKAGEFHISYPISSLPIFAPLLLVSSQTPGKRLSPTAMRLLPEDRCCTFSGRPAGEGSEVHDSEHRL